MQEQKTLFEDKDVKITNKRISIKCYYFPFTNSKNIQFEQIQKVQIRPLDMGKMRIWGMGVFNWGYWFPGDCSRPQRNHFIAIYIGSCIIPTFTTQNTHIAFNIISTELQKLKRNSTQRQQNTNQNSIQSNLLTE